MSINSLDIFWELFIVDAYTCTYVYTYMYMLGVLCAVLFSNVVCLTLLASFFLSSASLLNIYIHTM